MIYDKKLNLILDMSPTPYEVPNVYVPILKTMKNFLNSKYHVYNITNADRKNIQFTKQVSASISNVSIEDVKQKFQNYINSYVNEGYLFFQNKNLKSAGIVETEEEYNPCANKGHGKLNYYFRSQYILQKPNTSQRMKEPFIFEKSLNINIMETTQVDWNLMPIVTNKVKNLNNEVKILSKPKQFICIKSTIDQLL